MPLAHKRLLISRTTSVVVLELLKHIPNRANLKVQVLPSLSHFLSSKALVGQSQLKKLKTIYQPKLCPRP
jgi:hypothetical protein